VQVTSNMKPHSMTAFFGPLDVGMINVSEEGAPLVWQTSDFLVQSVFELPIPMPAGALVKFCKWVTCPRCMSHFMYDGGYYVDVVFFAAFSTKEGDISFGARFLSHNSPMEVVTENTRIPSDLELITGSYKAPREGALVLIFDNTYSWFTSKLLTYHAELTMVNDYLVRIV
jgi:hypothetical protein